MDSEKSTRTLHYISVTASAVDAIVVVGTRIQLRIERICFIILLEFFLLFLANIFNTYLIWLIGICVAALGMIWSLIEIFSLRTKHRTDREQLARRIEELGKLTSGLGELAEFGFEQKQEDSENVRFRWGVVQNYLRTLSRIAGPRA